CLLFNLAIELLAAMLRNHGPKVVSPLQIATVPGVADRAVVQLFADDTTAYLHKDDSFDDLKVILGKWCLAPGARFNVTKTEIIRKRLIETRKLNHRDRPIPDEIHIVKEDEAIRILGSFIGNRVDVFRVWTLVLEKIDSDYARWANLNPTLIMRKNIDQIVAGSCSQYLAQVNGMPPMVTKHILKAQKEFINDSKSSMISKEMLMAPRNLGGVGMFDLEARNDTLLLL
ncbi:hypothetical protein B0H17DRAFT_892716, partial [Mycena rosella]